MNLQIRLLNAWDRPRISILKKILLPRSSDSSNRRPVVGWLFFDGTEEELSNATDLILDLPGGGFICMTPLHHEERLRRWAICCKRPVLSIDYGKAPECESYVGLLLGLTLICADARSIPIRN